MKIVKIEPQRDFLAEAAKIDPVVAAYRTQLMADRIEYPKITAEDAAADEYFHEVMDQLADRWERAQKGERVGQWHPPTNDQGSGYPYDVAAE